MSATTDPPKSIRGGPARLPPNSAFNAPDGVTKIDDSHWLVKSSGIGAHVNVLPMTTTAACESCGMPIETGRYCGYCTDETGALQSFDERFERMTAWQARRNPGATRQEIEQQTLDYMATMPAWRDHPRVTAGRS